MPSRRRLTHTTSIPATSSLFQGHPNGTQHDTQPPVTFSQFIGGLTQVLQPVVEDEPSLGFGIPYPATSAFYADAYAVGANYFPEQHRATSPEQYDNDRNDNRANGWLEDFNGKLFYAGHGHIKEVDPDAVLTPPRQGSAAASSRHPSRPASHASFNGFHDESDFPLISTPPPPPRPRKLPSLKAHSTASEAFHHNAGAINWLPPPSTQPASPRPVTPQMEDLGRRVPPIPVVPDDLNEVALVTENLDLLESSQEAVRFLTTLFTSQSADLDLSQHIDLCTQIEDHLESIRQSLNLRTQMGSEEWHVRSVAWNQKYFKRLNSVKTTLQRLTRMTKLIDNDQSLRPRQRQSVLTKLEQHEAKLGDLASKYTAAFDRLRLRHLHFLLNQSHSEAKRAQKTRLASRQSFENYWQREKLLRSGLRHDFDELRQQLYGNNAPRGDRLFSAL